MNKIRLVLVLAVVAVVLPSCNKRANKYMYFQDMSVEEEYAVAAASQTVIRVDDRLGITVDCKNRELALPFNSKTASYSVSLDGSDVTSAAADAVSGYRVVSEGYINFPMIGRINVCGLTLKEAAKVIENAIIEGGYIKDPNVTIEFLNARYIVLGASGAGVYPMQGDKVTLLEAIAKAGDLADNAKLDDIRVIREVDGVRKVYVQDIRSKDIFDSPCYYLQQNDVIYVAPSYRRASFSDTFFKVFSLVTSALSVYMTYLWATK